MSRFNFSPSDIGSSAAHAAAPIEHAAAQTALGIEQGALAALHAAAEPISPIIQMIMRMPGQIGLVSSCFEAFGNFFFSNAQILSHLDPALLAIHADFSHLADMIHLPGTEHLQIDTDLLPADAPIFSTLHGGTGSNLFDAKAQFAHHDIIKDSVAFREQLKVSGQLDLSQPQYESGSSLSTQISGVGKGDLLSGPTMKDINSANHLAPSSRLFSEKAFGLPKTSPTLGNSPTVASATNLPSAPTAGSLNVSANPYNAVDSISQTATSTDASMALNNAAQNVSGNLNDASPAAGASAAPAAQAESGKQLIAMDNGSADFRPTTGAGEVTTGYDASYLQSQSVPAQASAHQLGGMKAQQMALSGDGVKPVANHAAAHSAGHAQAAHSATHTTSTASNNIHSASDTTNGATHHADSHSQLKTADAPKHAAHSDAVKHTTAAGSELHNLVAHPAAQTVSHATRHFTTKVHDIISHKAPTRVQYEAPKTPNQIHTLNARPEAVNQVAQAQPVTEATQPQATAPVEQATAPGADAPATNLATSAPSTIAPTATTTYTIRAGDCLWNIAKDNLHSATRWTDIYKMNTDVIGTNPSLIHPGTTINLPGSGTEVASGIEPGEYIVKSGDNLWNLSKQFLGDGSKWGDLYKANAELIGANPSLILPGQHLHIPGMEAASQTVAAAPDAATQQVAQAVPGGATVTSTPSAETAQLAAAPSGPEVQTPVQSYAPADVQAQPASFTQAPTVAPAAQAVPAQSAAPIGVQPSQPVGGPGAAAAATLRFPQPSPAELQQVVTEKPIVSSTLAPDLAQFLRKTK